ncbi:hypothetical protein IJ541_10545 [bacterium]|nr:hypothetical protein [bacterium]
MEMTGLQIFKYLPAAKKTEHTNCKQCGCPTCMAFALKLAKQNIEIEKCPYIKEELKNLYFQNIKHPQNTVKIGSLTIGGENVLYRHEKTFINRTVLAICLDCNIPDFDNEIKRISDFEIKGVNEILKIDLIILKNSQKIDINNLKDKISIEIISFEDYKNFEINTFTDNDFYETKDYLITTRTRAIVDKDEACSKPVCVWLKSENLYELTTHASFYICKYANMLVFETFEEALFSTILRLRQNIYTNPQKPLQVESDLYEFNSPDRNSIIFLTTNFALTFFAVANELEGVNIPSYLIVIPADGMSVLTAWSAEKFTANIVSKTIDKLKIREKINTRKIIIPGLLAHIIPELQQAVSDFEFIVGTNEASEIREFIKNINR